MSPSASVRFGDGIPWTTSWFREAQIDAGNPRYPLNDGMAPSFLMTFSATSSRSCVVRPGFTAAVTSSMVRATMRPARRIFAISSGDFRMITTAPARCQRGRPPPGR